jgi:hypothetical protein
VSHSFDELINLHIKCKLHSWIVESRMLVAVVSIVPEIAKVTKFVIHLRCIQ